MSSKQRVTVLIAHGSKRAEANLEIYQLAEKLEERCGRSIIPCFLELGEPNIPDAIDQALAKSPSEIVVLPYFLTQGRHLESDIPSILSEKARAFPETPIRILDYPGAHPDMIQLLEKIILAGR